MIKHKYPKIDSYLSKKKTIKNCFLVSRGRYVNDICNIFGVFAAKHVYNLKTYIISDTYQKNYNNSQAADILEAEMQVSPERDEILYFIKNSHRGIMKGYFRKN